MRHEPATVLVHLNDSGFRCGVCKTEPRFWVKSPWWAALVPWCPHYVVEMPDDHVTNVQRALVIGRRMRSGSTAARSVCVRVPRAQLGRVVSLRFETNLNRVQQWLKSYNLWRVRGKVEDRPTLRELFWGLGRIKPGTITAPKIR